MKQQMLEAEVGRLVGLVFDKDEIIARQVKMMNQMQIEIETLKAKVPSVGRGPSGASMERAMRNGQPNGYAQ